MRVLAIVKSVLGCVALVCLLAGKDVRAACPTGDSQTGTVKGTPIGIEYRSACTYLLVGDVVTTIVNPDTAPFAAGRFQYIELDPTDVNQYRTMLAIALTAISSGTRVYANVTGRFARADTLSFSQYENSNQ